MLVRKVREGSMPDQLQIKHMLMTNLQTAMDALNECEERCQCMDLIKIGHTPVQSSHQSKGSKAFKAFFDWVPMAANHMNRQFSV
eukprot:6108670-Amphidinium_carterae.1